MTLLASEIAIATEKSFLSLFQNQESYYYYCALVTTGDAFSLTQPRNKVYVNVEVMPPDDTNTIRALRLNKKENILDWLTEAAEG